MKNHDDLIQNQNSKLHFRSFSAPRADKFQGCSALAKQSSNSDLEEYRGILKYLDGSQELSNDHIYQDVYNAINYAFDQSDIPNVKKRPIVRANTHMRTGDSTEELPSCIVRVSDSSKTNGRPKELKLQETERKQGSKSEDVLKECRIEIAKHLKEKKDLEQIIINLNLQVDELRQNELKQQDQISNLDSEWKIMQYRTTVILQNQNQKYHSSLCEIDNLNNQVKILRLELQDSKKQLEEFKAAAELQIEAKNLENHNLNQRLKNAENDLKVIGEVWDGDHYKLEFQESVLKEKRDSLRKLMQDKIILRESMIIQNKI